MGHSQTVLQEAASEPEALSPDEAKSLHLLPFPVYLSGERVLPGRALGLSFRLWCIAQGLAGLVHVTGKI